MKAKALQAKDIADAAVTAIIERLSTTPFPDTETTPLTHPPRPVSRWEIYRELITFHPNIISAKLRKLVLRKVITGCACGCRGDFRLPPKPEASDGPR